MQGASCEIGTHTSVVIAPAPGRDGLFRVVTGRALALTTAGVLGGLLACVTLGGVLRLVLFETGPGVPRVLSPTVVAMLAAALAAA